METPTAELFEALVAGREAVTRLMKKTWGDDNATQDCFVVQRALGLAQCGIEATRQFLSGNLQPDEKEAKDAD